MREPVFGVAVFDDDGRALQGEGPTWVAAGWEDGAGGRETTTASSGMNERLIVLWRNRRHRAPRSLHGNRAVEHRAGAEHGAAAFTMVPFVDAGIPPNKNIVPR